MKEQLKQIIQESALSQPDKSLWLGVIEGSKPEIAEIIYSYLSKEPDKLSWLTQILKKKMEAIKSSNQKLWQEIISEELKEINKLK